MTTRVYSFGPFTLDTGEQTLLRDGNEVYLRPKTFELLVALVEMSGHLLSKDELMKQVWPDSFIEETNIAVGISQIRKVLGDSPNDSSYIETVPRRGYRFVACVSEVWDGNVNLSRKPAQTEVYGTPGQTEVYATSEVRKGTVAVLPFKHIGAAVDEYLGLGMADALITRLSNLRRVTVRPTSSVRHYNGSQDPVVAGKELRVEWVLDGNVQKVGKRVRVTVQLVNVDDAASRWAAKFDEKLTDIFAVEDWISKEVAKAVTPKVTRIERKLLAKRYTDNAEAYEAYLKGRYFFGKRTKECFGKGIEYFNKAIAIDPEYALAYAGLADCYEHLHYYGGLSPQETGLMSEKAAFNALKLDGELAEAHASLGHLRTRQWDFAAAEREYKRAIELKPNYAVAHHWYGVYLRTMGRFDDALAESAKALEIDPLSMIINSSVGLTLWLAGRYEQAIEQLSRTLELDPGFGMAHFNLGVAYEAKGMYEEALIQFQQAMTILGAKQPELLSCVGRTHALSGRTEKALDAIDELRRLPKENNLEPHLVALIFEALGDKDAALDWLEKGYGERDEGLALLKVDPRFDSLREDPRFESLLERVGLANTTNRQTLEAASGGRQV